MKRILSLAIILSFAGASVSWAEAPRLDISEPKKAAQPQSQKQIPQRNNKEQHLQQNQEKSSQHNQNKQQKNGQNQRDQGSPAHSNSGKGNIPPSVSQQGHIAKDHFIWNGNHFRKGQPAPVAFRGKHYQVDNWREQGLPTPPSGQHWSLIDGNYVLITAATGIITSIMINSILNN